MKRYEFDATIKKHEGIDAAYIEFPYDVFSEFNTKGQIKVKAEFDGVIYRGSLVKMGLDRHCLGIPQNIRKKISKNPGDVVHVILEQDSEPREVILPEDFKKLLEENLESKEFYVSLSYTSKKEYINLITSAKREATRKTRLETSIQKLKDKIKHP